MKKTLMLKKNYEFRNVLNRGKYYSGRYIEIFVKKNNKNNNFLGIAVSVKIGKAVKRNHLKRLIRESYYVFEENIKVGNSIVILCKKKTNVEELNFQKVKDDLEFIFKKANIFEENHEKNINKFD